MRSINDKKKNKPYRVPLNAAHDGNRLRPAVDALQKGFHL